MDKKELKMYIGTGFIILIIIVGLSYVFSSPRSGNSNALEKNTSTDSIFLMDTLIKVKISGKDSKKVINKCFERLQEIDHRMSATDPQSDVSKINKNPGQPVKVHPDTFFVIQKALKYAELSQGKFDPTVGALVDLWGIGTKNAQIPEDKEIEKTLSTIDYKYVELNEKNNTVKLKNKDTLLNLGGITKGYAADEVKKIISSHYENPSAFINLGGNVLVIGEKADGTLWNVGIQDPRKNRGRVMASIKTKNKTIVTSGNYERYFEKNGKIYHHIMDPDTGYPVRNNLTSVSIITENSLKGDALSTSIFILGVKEGLDFIENTKNVEALFITKNEKVFLSSGLKGKIKILNSDFEIKAGDNLEKY